MDRSVNRMIWIFTLLIVGMGLVTLYSAAYQNVRVPHKVFYDQVSCAVTGFILMFVLSRIDYRRFYDLAYIFYGANVVLLVIVLAGGRNALGATRWLEIGGISFQPSELAKLGLILALGRYFSDNRPSIAFNFFSNIPVLFKDLMLPLAITGVPMLLIFKQPDLGSALLFFGIFLIMLFVSGIRYRYFLGFCLLCLSVAPFGWHVLKAYQKDRLLVFLNPNIDPLGAGYTIIQSRIAIGSGQVFGKGWLAGTQNQLNFLPERHTDFIFSVVGEEWGLLGALFLLACYWGLIHCGLKISGQVKDQFGTQVAIGIVGVLTLQVVINMGMVLGLLPVVGLTLPLLSYGRTSFMFFMITLGFLLN
ncbi:MAG: rod shape-determining protein RodA, partial [Candidatus Omnitrophota bacterium]|nr:rod shape-determining protein RodA [Candidatus Omnitrophota bacterium]